MAAKIVDRDLVFGLLFLPRTIPDWNNLNIENLSNCNLDFVKDYLSS